MSKISHVKTSSAALTVLALAVVLSGCLRTRLLVYSDPPGAKVSINNHAYGLTPADGVTPLEVNLNWYWRYQVELEKQGFQKITAEEEINAPWWATFPLDFFVEIIPVPFLDEHYRLYKLVPAPSEDLDAFLETEA